MFLKAYPVRRSENKAASASKLRKIQICVPKPEEKISYCKLVASVVFSQVICFERSRQTFSFLSLKFVYAVLRVLTSKSLKLSVEKSRLTKFFF